MYTHTFKFKIGDHHVEGQAEFNVDGEASFKLDGTFAWNNRTVTEAERVPALFAELKRIFLAYGSINEIEITQI